MALLITNWIAGYIADGSVSKSRPFLVGIGVMLIATLIFFLSTDPYLIIFARALQGASEALVWVSGIAFLVSQVDEANLGVCMGYTTLGATIGELIGPLLGGYLYEKLGHWAVFSVVEVVIAADIVLRLLVKEKDASSQQQTLVGAVKGVSESDALLEDSVTVSQGTIDNTLSTDLEHGEEDGRSTLSGTTDCGDDFDDASALRTLGWNWLSSVIGAAIACVVRSALEATIPIYVLRHFGWTSSAGGGVMFALLLPMVGGPWVGKYTTLHGPRWFSTIASLACGVFMITLGFLTGDDTTTQILFVINVGFIGLWISIGTTTQTTAISAAALRAESLKTRIRASGVEPSWGLRMLTPGMMLSGLSTAWALGLFLGPACGSIFHFSTNQEWMRLCCFLGMICLVTGGYCSLTWRKWR
ncbi:major facilitator superfamily domain-containing protein [Trichoderma ceciliae]